MTAQQHVLIIGIVWPEPNSSAAGSRMMQLIELFKTQNWKITFATAAQKTDYCFNPEILGISTHSIEINNASFDDFIKNIQPTYVLFDRFITEEQFGWRVAEICPNAVRIIDTEDLHCLRAARYQAVKEGRAFEERDLMNDVSKREIASILRSDLSLMISKAEMNLLQTFFKVDKNIIHYVPFLLDPIDLAERSSWKRFEERKHFISIGNFLHEPNWNAVLYLKETIWPLVRKHLPNAELYVYGAYPSRKVENLHNVKEGFLVKGRAEDSKSVMRDARVCLSPLRFGAGLKGKLIEAMLCGTPSVTTEIGAEAMHDDLEWSGVIENDPIKFAKAAVDLYSNEKLWLHAQNNGIKIINNCYQKKELSQQLIERIISIQSNITKHREQNFIGSLLMHHTLASTKYMSKWIEEKNK